jgi:Fe-S cluster assembly ATP-binding protein
MGPNGSGKSSLVNALMGHPSYRIMSGALMLDGEDITALSPDKKAQRGLFLSLQHVPKVGGITLATFLHKVHAARTGEQIDVLEYYLALRDRATEFGISPDLADRPVTEGLSGGEKKLAEALQLVALRPAFALLDEIDSGVDIDALKKVFAVVEKLRADGTAFLIISHHPSLLDHLAPDAVHVMAAGKLVRSGGRALAEEILKDGFCKVIECPLEPQCKTAHHRV